MLPLREPAPAAARPGVTFQQMLERIRYDGAYPTRERAEEVTRVVLAALGRQLIGDERVDLAASLPAEAARIFAGQIPDRRPLTGWGFVKDLATRTEATPATARWRQDPGPRQGRRLAARARLGRRVPLEEL
ncbi:DUF2267 domain-containing protein, partial [Streptomyces sp. NPDC001939]